MRRRASIATLGFVAGRDVIIQPRLAEGPYDRLPAFAADLVNRRGEPDRDIGAPGRIRREGGDEDNSRSRDEGGLVKPPSPISMLLSRHTRRRAFIAGLGGAAAWPIATRAQQAGKVHRLGFLGSATAAGS